MFSDNATKFCHANGSWADKAVYDACVAPKESSPMDEDVGALLSLTNDFKTMNRFPSFQYCLQIVK